MNWQAIKSAYTRTRAGIVRNYFNAPQLTACFALLALFFLVSAIIFGFPGLWVAWLIVSAFFCYGGWVNGAPKRDEYGADGL